MDSLSSTIAMVAVILVLFYYYATRNFGYWKDRGVTFVDPYPLVGSLWTLITLQEHASEFFSRMAKKFKGREKFVGYFQVQTA